MSLHFTVPKLEGRQRVVTHLGFQGGAKGGNKMDVALVCKLRNAAGKTYAYPTERRKDITSFKPMDLVERVVNVHDLGGPGPVALDIEFQITNSGFDAKHPPGLFGLRLIPIPATAKTPPIKTDLAISSYRLIPNRQRFASVSTVASVEIENKGPNDIPANLTPHIKLRTKYYTGLWGNSKHEAQTIVDCLNGFQWTGAFKVGDKVSIIPYDKHTASPVIPGGVFTKWTKFFGAETEIVLPSSGELVDTDLSNNKRSEEHKPPLVFGDDAGPYEVILFEHNYFRGGTVSFECRPTIRQKLIARSGEPLNDRNSSIMIGSKVAVLPFEHANSNHDSGSHVQVVQTWYPPKPRQPRLPWMPKITAPGYTLLNWRVDWDDRISSLIIFPSKWSNPIGIKLVDTGLLARHGLVLPVAGIVEPNTDPHSINGRHG